MNQDEAIQKSLAKITSDEKGWRKALAAAENRASKVLAEENLNRLAGLRKALSNQANAIKRRREHVMQVALADGMITDHISDGVCEQLVKEGWLEHLAQQATRPHVSRASAYLPTDKAAQGWQNEADTSTSGKS
ncbi:MAG TPA: hypothetical protein VHD90_02570 [Phototrophicaceae bacterium]|nr:hypothetical protein [Phototrophicaceae bacterium]